MILFLPYFAVLELGQGCKIWLADSKLPDVGNGVFSGRVFKEGETIARTQEVLMRREVIEYTPLWHYAFHLRPEKVMSVLLGAASMLNHGQPQMVNVRFSRDSDSIIKVIASRDIEEGEELFTSYGSEDWFLDRHIPYRKLTDLEKLDLSPAQKGVCLDSFSPDSFGSVVTERHLRASERIQSPLFLIPRWLASRQSGLMSHCFGDPAWDVIALPFLVPGTLAGLQEEANVVYSLSIDAEISKAKMQDVISTTKSAGTLHITPLRDILPGEKLVAKLNLEVQTQFHEGFCALPLSKDLPRHWESVHFWQSQESAAEAGDPESQFKVAEAFRLGLRPFKSHHWSHHAALAWYRHAAKQGHLEATFRAGATLHDFLVSSTNSTNIASRRPDFDAAEAADWFSKAAVKGHVRAQLLLSEMSIDGKFLPQNRSRAAFWGRKALASGASRVSAFCESFYEIALAFNGSDRDHFFWLQVAAEAGSPNAQYVLGQGLGDTPEALNFLHQAATQGHADAAFALGVAILEQNTSTSNTEKAVSWFRIAAEKGHGAAQYNLGIALTNAGDAEGVKWLEAAAANGFQKPGIQGILQQLQQLPHAMWNYTLQASTALQYVFSS